MELKEARLGEDVLKILVCPVCVFVEQIRISILGNNPQRILQGTRSSQRSDGDGMRPRTTAEGI